MAAEKPFILGPSLPVFPYCPPSPAKKALIRWEEDFGEFASDHEWLGYLGAAHICTIGWNNDLYFFPLNHDYVEYTSLSSAKRGAERMLAKFLKDAGLEVSK